MRYYSNLTQEYVLSVLEYNPKTGESILGNFLTQRIFMTDLVKKWKLVARRDDVLNRMVPSDIRMLVGEIERLRGTLYKIQVITDDPHEGFEGTVDVCNNLACTALGESIDNG